MTAMRVRRRADAAIASWPGEILQFARARLCVYACVVLALHTGYSAKVVLIIVAVGIGLSSPLTITNVVYLFASIPAFIAASPAATITTEQHRQHHHRRHHHHRRRLYLRFPHSTAYIPCAPSSSSSSSSSPPPTPHPPPIRTSPTRLSRRPRLRRRRHSPLRRSTSRRSTYCRRHHCRRPRQTATSSLSRPL